MKTLLFSSILFLVFFLVQGKLLAYSLPELRENDWFDLECVQPYPFFLQHLLLNSFSKMKIL